MKSKFPFFAVFIFAMLTACPLVHAASFTVEDISGTVRVLKAGTSSWISAENGMTVEAGDTVKTEDNSKAKLKMGLGEIILAENTNFGVTAFSDRDNEIQASLDLTIGQLQAKIGKMKKGSLMQFRTPTSVASVRGTWLGLFVYIFEGQLFTRLDVFDGIVGFADSKGQNEQNVGAGQRSIGDKDGMTPPLNNVLGDGDSFDFAKGPKTISQEFESDSGFQQDTSGSQSNISGNPNMPSESSSSEYPSPSGPGDLVNGD